MISVGLEGCDLQAEILENNQIINQQYVKWYVICLIA